MREIKFRGLTKEGKWVYGYLLRERGKSYIVETGKLLKASENGCYEVFPETIGQFTGLKDKNGKEIYEGDIIEYWVSLDGKIKDYGKVTFNKGAFRLKSVNCLEGEGLSGIKVVGNIHENPELLKD